MKITDKKRIAAAMLLAPHRADGTLQEVLHVARHGEFYAFLLFVFGDDPKHRRCVSAGFRLRKLVHSSPPSHPPPL